MGLCDFWYCGVTSRQLAVNFKTSGISGDTIFFYVIKLLISSELTARRQPFVAHLNIFPSSILTSKQNYRCYISQIQFRCYLTVKRLITKDLKMAYAWLMIVRAIASIFAIIELGLTAYGTLPPLPPYYPLRPPSTIPNPSSKTIICH